MLKEIQNHHWKWLLTIILVLAFSRLIPHPPNFTPVCAMALLSGTAVKDLRLALLIPLLAMLLSDALLGFHSSMLFVYGAIAIIVVTSRIWLIKHSLFSLVVASVSSALIFFIVTNFGAWLSHNMYPNTLTGLWQAYLAGIPFFKNTLISSLIFTVLSFYALTLMPRKQRINA